MDQRDRTTITLAALLGSAMLATVPLLGGDLEEQFEMQVRPVLVERCFKCHSGSSVKGGLRLDSRAALLQGGESGGAIVVGRPEQSLLIHAVRHENSLEMPPDGRLSAAQVAALSDWIRNGAVWPDVSATSPSAAAESAAMFLPKPPDNGDLAPALQLWLRADAIQLEDGQPVHVWPDHSGHGRDVSATKGVRNGGVGLPGSYVRQSALLGRPAVRFNTSTGLASSPGNPVDIRGDAALTIVLVMNLQSHQAQPPFDTVFCIGDPAHAGDPGHPLAALVEIDRTQGNSLDFAGGWGHDATPAAGSFQQLIGQPIILTIVKQPGPMRETTRFYVNGELLGPVDGKPLSGRDTVPDIRHRADVGVFLGKALGFCGAIQGDVGDVLVYNSALRDADRQGIEAYLGEKYGLWLDPRNTVAQPPLFTVAERSHWAYQPVRHVTPPSVNNEGWVRTPVDRFILAALEGHSLSPPPEVDRITFLRRVTFDLTGLPPTPEEVSAFLADTSPTAFESVVDRLLESPHYGERWGRHWLDVVRYAESTANDANAVLRYAWRYRNYVIDAFNHDLPYDQFLIEQLAGDLLPPTESIALNARRTIATGYLMIGPKALAETDKEQSRLDIVDDQIDVTGRAMLALTIACARCHDHKFDAIRTTDYYALAGIFRSTEPFQDENRNATMWWEYPVSLQDGAEPIMVLAPKEAQPRNLRVHLRGNRFTLGKIVPRGVPQILSDSGRDSRGESPPVVDPHQMGSGRLELARWITSPANPMTARVMVNRIWQHHFGRGIVVSSDNFGTRGEPPADPALLDWLAAQFVEGGWSVKRLHRLIVLSSAYRLQNVERGAGDESGRRSSTFPLQFHRRRLSAEELRDAMLAVSGRLDRTPGSSESGEFLFSKAEDIGAKIRPNRVAADDEFYTQFTKRSVYLPVVRNMLPDVLTLFDAADPNSVTAVRNETTVPSQALFLLNHPFVREQALVFAQRLLANEARTDDERVVWAHRLAFGRPAEAGELEESREFFEWYKKLSHGSGQSNAEHRVAAWQAYCQSLLCSNEFAYVE